MVPGRPTRSQAPSWLIGEPSRVARPTPKRELSRAPRPGRSRQRRGTDSGLIAPGRRDPLVATPRTSGAGPKPFRGATPQSGVDRGASPRSFRDPPHLRIFEAMGVFAPERLETMQAPSAVRIAEFGDRLASHRETRWGPRVGRSGSARRSRGLGSWGGSRSRPLARHLLCRCTGNARREPRDIAAQAGGDFSTTEHEPRPDRSNVDAVSGALIDFLPQAAADLTVGGSSFRSRFLARSSPIRGAAARSVCPPSRQYLLCVCVRPFPAQERRNPSDVASAPPGRMG